MAKTAKERKADQRTRMLKLGYKRMELWVKSEFIPLIKEYSNKLHSETVRPNLGLCKKASVSEDEKVEK